MGGIVKGLFGGSDNSSTQQSSNRAWDVLKDPLSGAVQTGTNALGSLNDIIGQGFDAFKKNSGFDFALNKGTRDRVGAAASKGIMNSGATAKALARYETDLGSQTYGNWLDRIGQVSQLGLGAGNTLVGAGGVSSGTSKGSSSNGILGGLFG